MKKTMMKMAAVVRGARRRCCLLAQKWIRANHPRLARARPGSMTGG
jgi:hypothetical protein